MTEIVSVIYADESRAALLYRMLEGTRIVVTDRAAFRAAVTKRGVLAFAFVDADLLPQIAGDRLHVVALVDEPAANMVSRTVGLLDAFPWLSHVISTSLWTTSLAKTYLSRLIDRYVIDARPHPEEDVAGRVALLAESHRREARFERMSEFFHKHELSARTIDTLNQVAEELVMNSLYDAPVEAKFFTRAVPRTEQVALPAEKACEISYGVCSNLAFVRVRDPFGALTRDRMLSVLKRCSGGNVRIDPSRGGAGLGMWRVFSSATTLKIVVVPDHLTDITLGIATGDGRVGRQLLSLDLSFEDAAQGFLDSINPSPFEQSITLTGCCADY